MTKHENQHISRQTWQNHVFAVVCLLTCSLIYFSPLISHFETSIPGRSDLTDVTEYIWSVGWVRYALAHNADLTTTDYLFVPFKTDLRLDTEELLQSLIAYPFTNILGVVGAYNLVLIISFALNGILAYGLIYSIIRNSHAALVSANCLMLSGVLVWHFVVGRLALPALWIVISAVWCLKSLLDNPSLIRGFSLGLLLIAASFTDLQILLFSFIWIAFYLFYEAVRNHGFTRQKIITLGVALLVWGILFSIHYLPALLSAADVGYATPRLVDMAFYSFQLSDFTKAEMIPYIYGFDFLIGAIGAVFIFRWQGEYRFWLVASVIILFLTLGPYLKPYDNIPLPFSAISLWSPAMQFRTPYRLVIPALLGWAVTLGFLLNHFLSRVSNPKLSWYLVLLLVGVRLWYTIIAFPFESQTYSDYAFYHLVADESGDFAILEVPFGIRSGLDRIGDGGEAVQYYQHIHNKRLLNGSISRLPTQVFEFYRSHPVLLFLAGESSAELQILERDFVDVLGWSNTKYVVVHLSLLPPAYARQIESFLGTQPQLELFMTESDLIIYKAQR